MAFLPLSAMGGMWGSLPMMGGPAAKPWTYRNDLGQSYDASGITGGTWLDPRMPNYNPQLTDTTTGQTFTPGQFGTDLGMGPSGGAPRMPQITPNPAFEDFYAQQKAAGGTFPGIMDAWQAQQYQAPKSDVLAGPNAYQGDQWFNPGGQPPPQASWKPWWGG